MAGQRDEQFRDSHNDQRQKELAEQLARLIKKAAAIDFCGTLSLEFSAKGGWLAKPITSIREVHQ